MSGNAHQRRAQRRINARYVAWLNRQRALRERYRLALIEGNKRILQKAVNTKLAAWAKEQGLDSAPTLVFSE